VLAEIDRIIRECRSCPLHATRKTAVPGFGSPNSKILFIGEAPGYWEDVEGKPFVGRGGKLLTEELEKLGIKRDDVFITNIVKCRPPENRKPADSEIAKCSPYLDRQIEALSPRVIVTLGAVSGEYISKKFGFSWTSMLKENGAEHTVNGIFGKITIIPVLHPAAVLRDPNKKERFVSALEKIKKAEKNG
jgi:uracil-DNA glycosylase family 4